MTHILSGGHRSANAILSMSALYPSRRSFSVVNCRREMLSLSTRVGREGRFHTHDHFDSQGMYSSLASHDDERKSLEERDIF